MTDGLKNWGPLRFSLQNRIGILEFNDPERRNAVGPAMVAGLLEALDEISAMDIGCLVLTGVGSAFSSGGDMAASQEIATKRQAGENIPRDYTLGSHHHPALRSLRELPFPLITAVNGAAVGIGASYALMGDLIVAARSAFFIAGFTKVGLSPDGGISWLLPRLVGSARAREIMMLGERISADEALAWGMINRVFDDAELRGEALALAQKLASGPTLALQAIRRLSWRSWHASHEEQLDEEERLQTKLGSSQDMAEGVRAFLEKRPPKFTGR